MPIARDTGLARLMAVSSFPEAAVTSKLTVLSTIGRTVTSMVPLESVVSLPSICKTSSIRNLENA